MQPTFEVISEDKVKVTTPTVKTEEIDRKEIERVIVQLNGEISGHEDAITKIRASISELQTKLAVFETKEVKDAIVELKNVEPVAEK